MGQPVIVPRAEHTISRQQIDQDALRVLYRLHQSDYAAYLVGGSVRDLLLGRRPKDFDIGTSAHPHQVKRLFRNCWIIGRRFRLAHIRYGQKTIEVATFRRLVSAAELAALDAQPPSPDLAETDSTGEVQGSPASPRQHIRHAGGGRLPARLHGQRALLRHRIVFHHRLHRWPRGPEDARDPMHRRPGREVSGGSGPHAARRRHGRAPRLHDRSADRRRDRRPSGRDRQERARTTHRGAVQAAADRGRRACVPHARGTPAARADRTGAAKGQRRRPVAVARSAGCLPHAVRDHSRLAHQRRSARLVARADRILGWPTGATASGRRPEEGTGAVAGHAAAGAARCRPAACRSSVCSDG